MTWEEELMSCRIERVTLDQITSQPILNHTTILSDDSKEWKKFKSLIQPGDELWTFSSPQEVWRQHMGRQGILLVRDGKLIDACVTRMN